MNADTGFAAGRITELPDGRVDSADAGMDFSDVKGQDELIDATVLGSAGDSALYAVRIA